jgi:hypothetical protein
MAPVAGDFAVAVDRRGRDGELNDAVPAELIEHGADEVGHFHQVHGRSSSAAIECATRLLS